MIQTKVLLILSAAMLVSASFFTACRKDNSNNEYPDLTIDTLTIHGILKYKQSGISGTQLVAWPFGAAIIKVKSGVMQELASGTVNADGTFTLVLPGTISGSLLIALSSVQESQGGTIVINPNTVRILSTILFAVEYTDNGTSETLFPSLHTLNPDLSVDKTYFYTLYDADGTFIGTGDGGNTYDWLFTKGWGLVESYITDSISGAFNSKTVAAAPTAAFWSN